MVRRRLAVPALLVVTGLLPGVSSAGQAGKCAASHRASATAKPAQGLTLDDVTRVSTEEAARAAARATAQKAAAKHAQGSTKAGGDSGDAVVEFHPANRELQAEGQPAQAGARKHPAPWKNVHGSVSGALDSAHPGTHQEAASVGATSKGGRTSVYVETGRSRTTSTTPH